jgi:hypothetical protein
MDTVSYPGITEFSERRMSGCMSKWVSKRVHNLNPAKTEGKGRELVLFSNIYYSYDKRLSTSGLTTAANKVVKAIFNFITRIFNNIPPFLLYTRGVHNVSRAIS